MYSLPRCDDRGDTGIMHPMGGGPPYGSAAAVAATSFDIATPHPSSGWPGFLAPAHRHPHAHQQVMAGSSNSGEGIHSY